MITVKTHKNHDNEAKMSSFSWLLWLFWILILNLENIFTRYRKPQKRSISLFTEPKLPSINNPTLILKNSECDPAHFKPWKQLNYAEKGTCWYHGFHLKIIFLFLESYTLCTVCTPSTNTPNYMNAIWTKKKTSHFKTDLVINKKNLLEIRLRSYQLSVSWKILIKKYAPYAEALPFFQEKMNCLWKIVGLLLY